MPSPSCAGAHIRRRAVLGQGFPVHAAHWPEVVLPRVPRWGHCVPDHQVRHEVFVIRRHHRVENKSRAATCHVLECSLSNMLLQTGHEEEVYSASVRDPLGSSLHPSLPGCQIRETYLPASTFSLTRAACLISSLPLVWSLPETSRYSVTPSDCCTASTTLDDGHVTVARLSCCNVTPVVSRDTRLSNSKLFNDVRVSSAAHP